MTPTVTAAPLTVRVALPENITRIATQSALYGYGVALFGYQQVADEQEAIECADGRTAFLLKSPTLPCFYLIFPHVVIEPARAK